MEYFRLEFGEGSSHVTFAWNEEAKGDIREFLAAGFDWDETVVLKLKEPKFDFPGNTLIDVRPLSSDADWRAVTELQIEMSDQEITPGFIEFKERAMMTMRHLHDRGIGSWWGAFIKEKLVGDMGLFFDFEKKLGRFQSVETHPDFQNRGICKTILKTVVKDAIETKGISDLVIVTEPDNHAGMVYRSCGFVDHSKQSGVCHPKPYWKETSPRTDRPVK